MPKNVTLYDLLISCPGDIAKELEIIHNAAGRFNGLYGNALELQVRVKHWSKDSYPESGGKPQDLLNKQFVFDCDAAVAIFWTRFGTPTDEYGSGTEEEIEEMLKAGKQVFLYFSDKPINPSLYDSEQHEKVKAFRAKYQNKGIYWTYDSDESFGELFFAHLSQYFLSQKKIDEIENSKKPILALQAINDNSLVDDLAIVNFALPSEYSQQGFTESIKKLFVDIPKYKITPKNPLDAFQLALSQPIVLGEEKEKVIRSAASSFGIELPEHFFALGGLRRNSLAAMFGGTEGTDDEIKKHDDLRQLYEKILDRFSWANFEASFCQLKCIRLAVKNKGATADEDIDIDIRFPKGTIILPECFPILDEYTFKKLQSKDEFSSSFEIFHSLEYDDYSSSRTHVPTPYVPRDLPIGLFAPQQSFIEEYREWFDDVMEYYAFFDESESTVVRLHIDYLKHNNAVAFPTLLFCTDSLSEISYIIRSKHCEKPIEGALRVTS